MPPAYNGLITGITGVVQMMFVGPGGRMQFKAQHRRQGH